MGELANRYPVGIQSFEDIRRRGLVYVDKTQLIWRLAHQSDKAFLLLRPRRFGKSLLISTLQAYLEGRRELFCGLALDKLEREWEPSPVLRLDMSTVKGRTLDMVMATLDRMLRRLEDRFGCDGRDATPGTRLQTLIDCARAQAGRQVVVLVDEYDSPLLNVRDDPELVDRVPEMMREFYAPLKARDEDLRFVLLTGITTIGQRAVLADLNNLRNISREPEFAALCGFTEDELRDRLAPDVASLAKALGMDFDGALARLKSYYDGYHFCAESPDIYNPFSLLTAFAKGEVGSYWFGTGTPSFLIRTIRSQGWQMCDLDERGALETSFDVPTEAMDTPLPLLYQSGYLTIKSFDPESRVYTLGIPNVEVSRGFSEGLVAAAAPGALDRHSTFLIKLARSFRADDIEAALELMRSYLAGIPYHLGSRDERGFQTKFYLIFDLLGIQIFTEFRTATGRVDAVVHSRDTVYVMEFKYDKPAAEALAQIDSKDYALPFAAGDKRVVKVGVSFCGDTQTLSDWIVRHAG